MKEFFIIMNPEKQGAKETAQVIRDYLTSHGASCLIGKGDGRRGGDYHYTDASMVPPETASGGSVSAGRADDAKRPGIQQHRPSV